MVDRAAESMKAQIDSYVENDYSYAHGEIDVWLVSKQPSCTVSHKLYQPIWGPLTRPSVWARFKRFVSRRS